jgi:hypothetical protein
VGRAYILPFNALTGRLDIEMGINQDSAIYDRERTKIIPGVGIIETWGTVAEVPVDGSEGFAPGCRYTNIECTALTNAVYINIGTLASSNFDVGSLA